MSRYNRCGDCYNMKCIFVTGEREDLDTSECKDFRPMSNADRIRQMSDEELATNLYLFTCVHVFDSKVKCKDNGCRKCWLDWLKSPVEVDNG